MLFNSIDFLFFFPVVTGMYFLLPYCYRAAWLLLASCVFYAVLIPKYLLILFGLITVDYFAGILIEKQNDPARKKVFLILSILSTCLVLFVFKYFNFFNENLGRLAAFFGWNYPIGILKLALPVGLSFHTFQSLSYVMEVYRGKQKAERNFLIYSLYVMFFPQLVAGPIERPQNMIHQFYQKLDFNYHYATNGLKLMAWGLFKKMIIADRLALVVNPVFAKPEQFEGVQLLLAAVLFSIQIYCDFSGYSDVAMGSARFMGFKLMENFRQPYFSQSIGEFWKRWHISLSTWFRDYLYLPLGGNRVSKFRWGLNILVVFVVSGLWHGANWTFICWGMIHGICIILSVATLSIRAKAVGMSGIERLPLIHSGLRVAMVFLTVTFSWIFFRANSLTDAKYMIIKILSGTSSYVVRIFENMHSLGKGSGIVAAWSLGQTQEQMVIICLCLAILLGVDWFMQKGNAEARFSMKPVLVRWAFYYALIMGIVLFRPSGAQPFIYFQF